MISTYFHLINQCMNHDFHICPPYKPVYEPWFPHISTLLTSVWTMISTYVHLINQCMNHDFHICPPYKPVYEPLFPHMSTL